MDAFVKSPTRNQRRKVIHGIAIDVPLNSIAYQLRLTPTQLEERFAADLRFARQIKDRFRLWQIGALGLQDDEDARIALGRRAMEQYTQLVKDHLNASEPS
jgi:hypothetical protein